MTVLPSFIIGPSLPPDLCSTASDVLGLLKGETERFQWHGRMGYVHIDDVALSHILLYENQSSHGRYLCNSTVMDNNHLVALLATLYPSLPIPKRYFNLVNASHCNVCVWVCYCVVYLRFICSVFRFKKINGSV